jgi:hypothetical protein
MVVRWIDRRSSHVGYEGLLNAVAFLSADLSSHMNYYLILKISHTELNLICIIIVVRADIYYIRPTEYGCKF